MKLSDKPTAYLLLRASTNSEWDFCDFAIVRLSEEWRQRQCERLEHIRPFSDIPMLLSMDYYDMDVHFFKDDDEICPDSDQLMDEREWSFVETDEHELETLSLPENWLDGHMLMVYKDGSAKYKAYGKHTGEEFWTARFSLTQLLQTTNHTRLTG